ncbi:uncharacterized protein E0L32_004136 [Thyridium curvatum]|uniref:Methyltransferase type 11 domain-containing protein n=1 Tax=Thyridium curvatum TaxID=1093900 RepID=A0A507BGM3_9PEZI|nr:uncharacterized protein E0L32_004136 [Thyridium curvatum]TPX16141.1 hypothetical protein E0L32_004136 [Thyridium curvatum]
MSAPPASRPTASTEKTFSAYNAEQGKAYAAARRDYDPSLYQLVVDRHRSTGGRFDSLVDVGCGPGLAARALAPHFASVVGLDPSDGMLATARALGGATATSQPIRYEVSTAEALGSELSPPVPDGSVDLITAANAAHWFDMAGFWPAAARALRPGGSVALWTSGPIVTHPDMPNATAIQDALERLRSEYLSPYFVPGNRIVHDRYVDLLLPWDVEDPRAAEFDRDTFFRKDYRPDEKFLMGIPEADLDTFEAIMATGSPQTRWRQAHPDDVGTERDVIRIMRREIERLLHEAGVEKGKEKVKATVCGVLIMIKKKAE